MTPMFQQSGFVNNSSSENLQNTEIQYIPIISMNTVRFVKSFNKGQITIPKELRDALGMTHEFWLKLYTQNGRIIAEPVAETSTNEEYRKKLLNIKGGWFSEKEYKENRKQLEERSKKLNW